ncbi:hypothetical protein E6W39_13775 [Kitasatospora acidiphila]|uniref:Uncharacterized protein n=1 Tax=Kitasatospora acidiphila TaxID=2567942 RepID=A0A540W278_9ACTN|nr:hypothetical protein [Kitasatospora acidiphila]TQF03126.1 hypothetical protein E6W39_13775 [Kitasatospora acidiphila]
MNDEFSSALSEELSGLSEPPIGDLVGQAARRGRRIRRFRAAGATVAVAAVATVAALLTGSLGGPGHSDAQQVGVAAAPSSGAPSSARPSASTTPSNSAPPTAAPSASSPTSPPSSSASASGSGGSLVQTTTASLLAAVVKALPAGMTTDHYQADPPQPPVTLDPSVFLYLHSGGETGRIGVSPFKADTVPACQVPDGEHDVTIRCYTDPAGDQVQVLTNTGNCIQHNTVIVYRRDGIGVGIDLSSCFKNSPDGSAALVLSQDQAIALATNPLIDVKMPESFVQTANATYPNLPQ